MAILFTALTRMVIRQSPRSFPQNAAELREEAHDIIMSKCADCHDSSQPPPFYAKIPLLGKPVMDDYNNGIRHWDPFDRSYLGAAAATTNKTLFPLSIAEKTRKVLAINSMPPRKYTVVHWGAGLSRSEKEILAAWAAFIQAEWLVKWGINGKANQSSYIPLPKSIPHDAAKAKLGEKLYNDKRLSSDNTISCASCHDLTKGGTDNLRYSKGVDGQLGGVNAPTVYNAVFNIRQFWDGRAADLAEQAGGPPLNPVEMASTNWTQIIVKLDADAQFKEEFLKVYPEGFSEKTICEAIAEYEKTLLTPNSAFDRYLNGEANAIDKEEKRGMDLFNKYSCISCHNGPTLGGQSFEYADLKADYFKGRKLTDGDKGLEAFSKKAKDSKRFKVPSLRNLQLTAPYMHDGSIATINEAVASMLRCQVGVPVNDNEVAQIVDFLCTLTPQAAP